MKKLAQKCSRARILLRLLYKFALITRYIIKADFKITVLLECIYEYVIALTVLLEYIDCLLRFFMNA